MADLPLHVFDQVAHIGTWPDAPDPRRKPGHDTSYEGIGLSVSVHPDAWRAIVKLGGYPLRWLERSDGLAGSFVDAYAVLERARSWAQARGLLRAVAGWKVSWWDDELEDELSFTFLDRAEAEEEADERGELSEARIWIATGELKRRLDAHYGVPRDGQHGALEGELLNRWLAANHPGVDGVWWDNRLDPAALSAPGGIIIPERLGEWRVARLEGAPRR